MGIEFVGVSKNVVKAFHNERILAFNELPDFAYRTIKELMKRTDATLKEMEEFAFERWGGLDNVPDICENGVPSEPEYVPGINCAYYDDGTKISETLLRVLQNIKLKDKAIAEKIHLSPFTVYKHIQALLKNTGCSERYELIQWATKKGII